jgi:hypothetical protein
MANLVSYLASENKIYQSRRNASRKKGGAAVMTHDEMIAVIQHHKNGGEVECLNRSVDDDRWVAIKNPAWNFPECDYRAKPEPATLWLELDKNELVIASYKNRTIAQYGGTIKKFIEVTQ